MTAAPPSARSARRAQAVGARVGGFTLVEVLVALTIVAVALAAALRAAMATTDNAERLSDVVAAQWCAENELTALRLAGALPGIGDTQFECEQLGRAYAGVLRTRPTPNPNFRRVDAVMSTEQGRPLLTLSTVLSRQ